MASEGAVPALPPHRRPSAGDHDPRDLLAEGRSASPLAILRRLVTHPIIVAILARLGLPAPRRRISRLRSGRWSRCSAPPRCPAPSSAWASRCSRYGFQAGWKLPALIAGLKLVRAPAHRLRPGDAGLRDAARPGRASPCSSPPARRGINAYLFAERYGEGVAIASSAVALSTALGPRHTLVWLQVLGVG